MRDHWFRPYLFTRGGEGGVGVGACSGEDIPCVVRGTGSNRERPSAGREAADRDNTATLKDLTASRGRGT